MKLHFLVGCLLLSSYAFAEDHPINSYPNNAPPSVELHYKIKANKYGMSLAGEANVIWQINSSNHPPDYSIRTETKAALFGRILQADSVGRIDPYGLAPERYDEKPANKDLMQANFDRKKKTISFTESNDIYPIKGGEQDRTSAVWQLIAVVRAEAHPLASGASWNFFVAGRHDAEKWTFTFADTTTLSTPLGKISVNHFIKAPPPDSQGQRLDIWLAPEMEWYPVRLKFSDADGDTIDQTLDKVTKL